jgi:feruloyl esterase
VRWVEQGEAPAGITARARGTGNPGGVNAELPADWATSRTRTLCPWPTVSRYTGSGSLDDVANFRCAAP